MGQVCSSACSHVEPDVLELSRTDSSDPLMYDLMRKSIQATISVPSDNSNNNNTTNSNNILSSSAYLGQYKVGKRKPPGQQHLLYRNSKIETSDEPVAHTGNSMDPHNNSNSNSNTASVALNNHKTIKKESQSTTTAGGTNNEPSALWLPADTLVHCPTRLLIRRRSLRVVDDGGETHIYALRYPEDTTDKIISEQATPRPESARQEQCPPPKRNAVVKVLAPAAAGTKTATKSAASATVSSKSPTSTDKSAATTKSSSIVAAPMEAAGIFSAAAMSSRPRQPVMDWVTVSEDHNIYIADVGLTAMQCDHIVNTTELVCRGQYAAYTYAKQTLGCREYPILAQSSFSPVHTITSDIIRRLGRGKPEQQLQLDDREPHIVKYDVTKKERQKLDMHTDKSEWTFLIALSNGCGVDYDGGGTYFECLDATVHIQRGHALVFPGKLRHCGQKITSGLRFLLVGFLVDKSEKAKTSTAIAAATPTGSPNDAKQVTTGSTPASNTVPDKD